MLARQYRLRKQTDITRVLRQGTRKHSEHLILRWLPNRVAASRIVVIVSKKYDSRAVVRNRARRRVQEIMRQYWSRIPVGFDILVTVQSDISTLKPEQLKAEVESLARVMGNK